MAKRGPRQLPRRERFYSKVDVLSPDGCWLWSGVVNLKRGGYGYFNQNMGCNDIMPH